MSGKTTGVPRLQIPERQQMKLDERSLEQLLPSDHVARTVWTYVDGLDLSSLLACIKAVEGRPGQPTIDPLAANAAESQGCGRLRRTDATSTPENSGKDRERRSASQ